MSDNKYPDTPEAMRAEIDRLRKRTHEIQSRADKELATIKADLQKIKESYAFGKKWLEMWGMGAITKYGPQVAISAVANLIAERDELAAAIRDLREASLSSDNTSFPEAMSRAERALANVTHLNSADPASEAIR